jgi:hypothetical protein
MSMQQSPMGPGRIALMAGRRSRDATRPGRLRSSGEGLATDCPDPYIGIEVTSDGRGKAAFYLSTHPVESASVLPMDASAFAEGEGLHGVRVGAVQRLPVPNTNLSEAARVGFTGRRTIDGITYSVVGDCSRLRGAPSVNDVSVSICFMAYVPEDAAVRTEVRRMTASVAQSI